MEHTILLILFVLVLIPTSICGFIMYRDGLKR